MRFSGRPECVVLVVCERREPGSGMIKTMLVKAIRAREFIVKSGYFSIIFRLMALFLFFFGLLGKH
jgi:hypothetical protein